MTDSRTRETLRALEQLRLEALGARLQIVTARCDALREVLLALHARHDVGVRARALKLAAQDQITDSAALAREWSDDDAWREELRAIERTRRERESELGAAEGEREELAGAIAAGLARRAALADTNE